LYSYVGNNPVTGLDPTGHQNTISLAGIIRFVTLPSVPILISLGDAIFAGLAVLAVLLTFQNLRCAVAIDAPGCGPIAGPNLGDLNDIVQQLLRNVAKLTRAAAVAAAAACAASFAAGQLAGLGDNPCSGEKAPIFFSGTDTPKTTDNIADAITRDHRPAVLNYAPSRTRTQWYNSTATCDPAARAKFAGDNGGDTGACDEYPFNSTTQNEQNICTVTLKLVPLGEALPQARALSSFYGGCRVADGGVFGVVPVRVPVIPVPSFGLCPRK
jgi:hypothetical protein